MPCYLGYEKSSPFFHKRKKNKLAKDFPDIVAMKNANSDVKKPVRGYNQGDTELYSNFGFMHVT